MKTNPVVSKPNFVNTRQVALGNHSPRSNAVRNSKQIRPSSNPMIMTWVSMPPGTGKLMIMVSLKSPVKYAAFPSKFLNLPIVAGMKIAKKTK